LLEEPFSDISIIISDPYYLNDYKTEKPRGGAFPELITLTYHHEINHGSSITVFPSEKFHFGKNYL